MPLVRRMDISLDAPDKLDWPVDGKGCGFDVRLLAVTAWHACM